MNRSVMSAVAAVGIAAAMSLGSAQAADMPVKGPLLAPASASNWNGCYVGLQGGVAWATANQVPTGRNLDPKGYLAGGQLGCNWHFSPNVVLGVEIDAAGANITQLGVFVGGGLTIEERIKSIVTLRARLGHTMGNSLLYLTGGAAWANAERFVNLFGTTGTATATHSGWVFGFGIEHAFSSHWSGKIEYLYHNLGSQTYIYTFGLNPTVDLKLQTLKFGVNYRF
jgi:outer membrane immunogenic protein